MTCQLVQHVQRLHDGSLHVVELQPCFMLLHHKGHCLQNFVFSRNNSNEDLLCVHLCVSPLNSFPKSIILCVVPEGFLRDGLVGNSLQSSRYLLF